MANGPTLQEAIRSVGAYIVATSERRLELKGRKWDEIRSLTYGATPAQIPNFDAQLQPAEAGVDSTVPRGASTEGWAIMRGADGTLADILHHCCLPLRFEPSNASLFHRGIASPGAKYPIDLRLLIPDLGEAAGWLRLDPYQACLFKVEEAPRAEVADRTIQIVLTGDISKCLDPYGDMSANLVALEVGMMSLSIALFAKAFGWRAQASLVGDAVGAREILGMSTNDLWPLVELRISNFPKSAARVLRHGSFRPTGKPPAMLAGSKFPLLKTYQRATECEAARSNGILLSRTDSPSSSYSSRALRKLFINRTSGARAGEGRPHETWSEIDIHDFREGLIKSDGAGLSGELTRFASVHLSFRTGVNELRSLMWRPMAGEFDERPSMPSELTALDNMRASFLATFGVDDGKMLARMGPRSHLAANVLVGMLAQRVTLAITSGARDARAIGAYDGVEASHLFDFDRRALLQVKAHRPTTPNPFFIID